MKSRPILFSGPMVRAILDGKKTQTRRLIKWPVVGPCPYGVPGDRLWVRETWAPHDRSVLAAQDVTGLYYRADDEDSYQSDGKWRPSIFMPRWASRIDLDVKRAWEEPLQSISEEDAIAEGISMVPFYPDSGFPLSKGYMVGKDDGKTGLETSAAKAYAKLWDSINAKRALWASNPTVTVIEFERVKP